MDYLTDQTYSCTSMTIYSYNYLDVQLFKAIKMLRMYGRYFNGKLFLQFAILMHNMIDNIRKWVQNYLSYSVLFINKNIYLT